MEVEHIVIRNPEFVAGSRNNPEVGVFVQTHSKHIPLNPNRLKPRQIVWMKWTSGPIVAKSRILSWHEGQVINGDIKYVRELTVGTKLFGLDNYWNYVSDKGNCFFVVIRLCEEEWLNRLIYPKINNRLSWVYLDTEEKKKLWLSNYTPPIIEEDSERTIPVGVRFEVFRRNNFTCVYCGRSAPEVELHIDHKVPWKVVKKHELNNLVTSCKDCNLGKKDKLI